MLEPILGRFEAYLKGALLAKPKIPIVSNLTGTWLTDAQARDAGYWRAHLRSRVKFAEGMRILSEDPARIYIEVGPGRTMSSLVKAQGSIAANQVINSLPHADEAGDDRLYFMGAVGRAWATGLSVPLERLWSGIETRRIPLPTYPFQHDFYWIAPNAAPRSAGTLKHATIDDWFAAPTWVRSPLLLQPRSSTNPKETTDRRWLVYSDGSALAARIARRLEATVVVATKKFRSQEGRRAPLEPRPHVAEPAPGISERTRANRIQTDRRDLFLRFGRPAQHAWHSRGTRGSSAKALHQFFVPTFIVRALGRLGDPVNFCVVTCGWHRSAMSPSPAAPTLIGPCPGRAARDALRSRRAASTSNASGWKRCAAGRESTARRVARAARRSTCRAAGRVSLGSISDTNRASLPRNTPGPGCVMAASMSSLAASAISPWR